MLKIGLGNIDYTIIYQIYVYKDLFFGEKKIKRKKYLLHLFGFHSPKSYYFTSKFFNVYFQEGNKSKL